MNPIKILQHCIILLGSKVVLENCLGAISPPTVPKFKKKKKWYTQSIIKFSNKYLLPALGTGSMQYIQQHLSLSPTAGDFGNWLSLSKVILEQRNFQFRTIINCHLRTKYVAFEHTYIRYFFF